MTGVRAAAVLGFGLLFLRGAYGQDPGAMPPQESKGQGTQEEDPRAKAIREAYEEQIRRERRLVTLKMKNELVEKGVEEFRKQGGVNIVLDRKNFPEDFRIDEFAVENEPFKKALEAFAAKAELAIEDVSPTLIRLSRPPRVTFNFRDADIKVVIDMIARVSGANIIVAPDVKGSISLSINNVPWNEVLSSVVKTLGYTTVQENFNIIRIIHPDELKKQMETRVFKLMHIQPPPIYSAKVEENKLLAGKPLTSPAGMDDLLKRFVLKSVLETTLSKDAGGKVLGRLDFDPQTNMFVATDTKIVLDRISEIIKLIDVEPEQVVIDLKFISTTNEDLLSFGMSYNFAGVEGFGFRSQPLDPRSFVSPNGTVTGKITSLPFGMGTEANDPHHFFLTEYDMVMAFRAFKQDRFSRLVQEPSITVIDNTEATIFVGETISYAESKAEQTQSGGLVFTLGEASKSPVKVGFQLFVIPKIVTESNKVILTVIPQNEFLSGQSGIAAVAGFERFTLTGAGVGGATLSIDLPRLTTNSLVTRLMIESGRTAVLGGLVIERSVYEDRGIPVLKDIPILSYLFKQRNDTIRKEHLLIFLTPRIVRRGSGPSQSLQQLLKLREENERREFEEMKKKAGEGAGKEEPKAPEEKQEAPK